MQKLIGGCDDMRMYRFANVRTGKHPVTINYFRGLAW